MASSSSGSIIPAPEAIQVLVSSLADESPIVREASMASLKDLSALNPLLVLDCCSAVSRGGRRRFGNMAGVFQVMAMGVRALDKKDVDPAYMAKLAKIATAEMISSKVYCISFFFILAIYMAFRFTYWLPFTLVMAKVGYRVTSSRLDNGVIGVLEIWWLPFRLSMLI